MGIFSKINELADRVTYGKDGPPKEPELKDMVFKTFYVSGTKYFEDHLAHFNPEPDYEVEVRRHPTRDGRTPLTVFLSDRRVGFISDDIEQEVESLLRYAYVIYFNIADKRLKIGLVPKR